jgi:hypothetical protein
MNPTNLVCSVVLILRVATVICKGSPQSSPFLTWGDATNGVRAGVHLQEALRQGNEAACQTIIYLGAVAGFAGAKVFCPTARQIFTANLTDSHGAKVTKTMIGNRFGDDPTPIAQMSDRPGAGPRRWLVCIPSADHETQVAAFNLVEHFKMQGPGLYTLTVRVRLYEQRGDGTLQLFKLPPVNVEVRVP